MTQVTIKHRSASLPDQRHFATCRMQELIHFSMPQLWYLNIAMRSDYYKFVCKILSRFAG